MKLPLKIIRKERPRFKGLKLHFIAMAIAFFGVYGAIDFQFPFWLSGFLVLAGFILSFYGMGLGFQESVYEWKTSKDEEYRVIQPWEKPDDYQKSKNE